MSEIDFITALGRLLRDGKLRDEFARNPHGVVASLVVSTDDQSSLLTLDPADLEAQAGVLLRKRFQAMQRWVPGTCTGLGPMAWETFHAVSRNIWAKEQDPALADAVIFLEQLEHQAPAAICRSERNRVRFALRPAQLRLYLVTDLWVRNKRRAGLQIFLGFRRRPWREQMFFFAV